MASVEECRHALDHLTERLSAVDSNVRRRHSLNRRLSCRVPDLALIFVGRLQDGTLHDVSVADDGTPVQAQVRLTVASDDLVALTDGRLSFATAWARGRLKIDASMLDLLKLRTLL
ncbi:MAG: SCP2 sterol-binding domain-containing protein [Frankiaceae bacterium]